MTWSYLRDFTIGEHTQVPPLTYLQTVHDMEMNTFEQPVSCAYCNKLLKGLFFQGYLCKSCNRCSSFTVYLKINHYGLLVSNSMGSDRIVYYKSISDGNWHDMKMIIIGHIFIQTKFCLWGVLWREQNFIWLTNMNNYYCFYIKIAILKVICTLLNKLFTLKVLYFCFNFVGNLFIKGFNTSTNWRANTFHVNDLKIYYLYKFSIRQGCIFYCNDNIYKYKKKCIFFYHISNLVFNFGLGLLTIFSYILF